MYLRCLLMGKVFKKNIIAFFVSEHNFYFSKEERCIHCEQKTERTTFILDYVWNSKSCLVSSKYLLNAIINKLSHLSNNINFSDITNICNWKKFANHFQLKTNNLHIHIHSRKSKETCFFHKLKNINGKHYLAVKIGKICSYLTKSINISTHIFL